MKKIIILSSALCLLGSYSANAEISVNVDFPISESPSYVIAPDYPSYHYDHHRHPHNDYWAHRQHDERDHNEHAHDNGHHGHDKDKHGEENHAHR